MSIQGMSRSYSFFFPISMRPIFLDTHVLPADIDKIFRRVQDSAHYMPDWQMEVRCLFPVNSLLSLTPKFLSKY